MEKKIEALKKKFPAIAGNLIMLPRIASLLMALFRDPRVPRWLKVMTGAIVTYVALPFDFLPDFVPLVGKGDDIVVILLVLMYYMKFCPPDVLREHWFNTMGDDYDMEPALHKALEELEPVVGERINYIRDNIEKLLGRFPRRAAEQLPAETPEAAD